MSIEIKKRLKRVLDCRDLDPWTRGFCESLADAVQKYGKLSERQMEVFEKKEKRYSLPVIRAKEQEHKAWISKWDQEKADRFELAACYYSQPEQYGYFSSITQSIVWAERGPAGTRARVDWNLTEIPTERTYRRYANNKYSNKAIQNYHTPPKFAVGSPVCIRNNIETRRLFRDNERSTTGQTFIDGKAVNCYAPRPYVVIQNHKASISACKGRRRYCILGAGKSSPIQVEERYLMKSKRSTKKKKK